MNKNLDNKRFILEDKDETKWLFFLSSSKQIQYYKLGEESKLQNNIVDSQPVRDFCATIDKNGTIRILAYTLARQLVYYEWINNRWERQILERIYSRFQNISYISILSTSDNIHILYYIESSLIKSVEFLVHYYFQDGKWYGGPLWKFVSDEATSPQATFVDPKDNVHIILTKQRKNGNQTLFHACFRSNSFSWTGPSLIHTSYGRCSQFQLFVNHSDNIYIAWVENIDNTYRLKYLYQIKDDLSSTWNEAILHQSSCKISSPTFIQNDELLCLWQENNVLYQIKSLDAGRSWSEPYPATEDYHNQLNLLYFVCNNRGKVPLHSTNIWAQGYPNIKLIGLEQSKSKELVYPEQPSQPDYDSKLEEIKSSLSLIKKEIKRNKTQIVNLSSQVEQLYSALYELQEQFKLKEKAIFTIQTEIKRLRFDIQKINQRLRPSLNVEVETVTTNEQPVSQELNISKDEETDKDNKSNSSDSYNTSTQQDAKTSEKSKETNEPEKIIVGSTTILINPEDSDEF